jgi:radical SAM protein with 4Fe4S-binding SPASM domain
MSSANNDMQGGPSGLSLAIREASRIYMPMNVTIELSQSCNLRCTHCYNFDRKEISRPKSDKPSLTPVEILRVIGEIRDAGGLVIAFSGGEALMHPHILDFVREARRLRMAVRLKTNGTLVTAAKARQLADAGVTDLEVSLYGASAAAHDPFTRVPGSFEKTVQGVRHAKELGITAQINFVMHRGCVGEVGEMLELAKVLNATSSMSMELTARYDGTVDSLDHRLTEEDLRQLYSGPYREYFAGSINTLDSVQCACARTNAGIGHDGTVYPCIGAPIASGDLRENTFSEIWRDSKTFSWIRGLALKDFKSCAPCEDRPFCQRSSGATFTNTGDYTGKEDWNCKQARLLKELNEKLSQEAKEMQSAELAL